MSLLETPNTKHQTPKKFQPPNSKGRLRPCFEFGDWRFFGVWCLVFGVFFSYRPALQSLPRAEP